MNTLTLPVETTISDESLMQQIARRNTDALAQLFDRYGALLKGLVLRVVHDDAEADDLLQEIFLQVWDQAQKYLESKGKPLGWLVTLSRRRAIDRLRKRESYGRAKDRFEAEADPNAHSVDDDISLSDMRHFLRAHISHLPPAQREVIELAYFKGMSQREIALHTETPLGTVKTRLELGLRKLSEAVHHLREKI